MSDISVPTLDIDERTEAALFLTATVVTLVAAYNTGQTGNPSPLFAACGVTALLLVFVDDE